MPYKTSAMFAYSNEPSYTTAEAGKRTWWLREQNMHFTDVQFIHHGFIISQTITTKYTIMKTIIFSVVLAFASIFQGSFAKTTHYEITTFKVSGNCEMCKNRIESALKKNAGVQSATWDVKTKTVTVVYNPHTVSVDQLHKLVADSGHDTDKIKATEASYKALPGCCKYKRV